MIIEIDGYGKIEIDDSQINIVIERLKNPLLYTAHQIIRLFNLSEPLEHFEVHSTINQYRQKFIELSSMKKYKNLTAKEINDFMNEVSEKIKSLGLTGDITGRRHIYLKL